jgi:hypothetical protein
MFNKESKRYFIIAISLLLSFFYLFSGTIENAERIQDNDFGYSIKNTTTDLNKSKSVVSFGEFNSYQIENDVSDDTDIENDFLTLLFTLKSDIFIQKNENSIFNNTSVFAKCKISLYILYCIWKIDLVNN